ncbi:MAG: hypothetical protein COB02_11360 [Candidatus Cloacimonadota bacterium]|nr:MAG: hypothetical protein COB02_11360 [Candidatus Cloacimonadota bacterium]
MVKATSQEILKCKMSFCLIFLYFNFHNKINIISSIEYQLNWNKKQRLKIQFKELANNKKQNNLVYLLKSDLPHDIKANIFTFLSTLYH